MVPHVVIIDASTSAAQITRSLITRLAPTAIVTMAVSSMRAADTVAASPPQLLIIDPARQSEADIQYLRAMQHDSLPGYLLVLTSEPRARLNRRLDGIAVNAVLEKGVPPAVLMDGLRLALEATAPAALAGKSAAAE